MSCRFGRTWVSQGMREAAGTEAIEFKKLDLLRTQAAWNVVPRLRQEGELTFAAPPGSAWLTHGERSRQDNWGFQAFLTTYESLSSGLLLQFFNPH